MPMKASPCKKAASRPGRATQANPVGGYYGTRKGYRGRFGNYVPPVMELLGLAEVEHNARETGCGRGSLTWYDKALTRRALSALTGRKTEGVMILAFDIGGSRIRAAAWDGADLRPLGEVPTPPGDKAAFIAGDCGFCSGAGRPGYRDLDRRGGGPGLRRGQGREHPCD